MKLTTKDKQTLRTMLALACKHDYVNTSAYEKVLAKIVPLGPIGAESRYGPWVAAKVEMGATHNGRVRLRKVFMGPNGLRFIMDKGIRVQVRQISRALDAHIHYVTMA